MKKLFAIVASALLAGQVLAAEAPAEAKEGEVKSEMSSMWPAFFAVGEWPASPDIVGLRLTIPFSTRQECVTGFDLGLWGRCHDFEGVQVNLVRNDVKDTFGGVQVGCYNSINRGDMFGVQAGLWNEAYSIRGVQVGLVNLTGDAQGVQVGLINRAETMYGYQIGIINVIRDSEVPVMPIVNIGF